MTWHCCSFFLNETHDLLSWAKVFSLFHTCQTLTVVHKCVPIMLNTSACNFSGVFRVLLSDKNTKMMVQVIKV